MVWKEEATVLRARQKILEIIEDKGVCMSCVPNSKNQSRILMTAAITDMVAIVREI